MRPYKIAPEDIGDRQQHFTGMPTKHEKPSEKKVTFIGHSYVRDLARQNFEVLLRDTLVTPQYIAVPGGTFKTFLKNPHYFDTLRHTQPEIVVVLLGGNDIKSEAGLQKTFEECSQFYGILRESVPCSTIVASQVETRFYKPNNRFGCPTHHRFDQLRRRFNKFLERHIAHDVILEIEGYLDDKNDYRDGVHLSHPGFMKYLGIIQLTVTFAEDRIHIHKNHGARKDQARY